MCNSRENMCIYVHIYIYKYQERYIVIKIVCLFYEYFQIKKKALLTKIASFPINCLPYIHSKKKKHAYKTIIAKSELSPERIEKIIGSEIELEPG